MKKCTRECGKRLGQATTFEGELKLARFFSGIIIIIIINYPSEAAKDSPVDIG
jgi:hypothetical protein